MFSDLQLCPALSEHTFSQGIQIASLLSPQKNLNTNTKKAPPKNQKAKSKQRRKSQTNSWTRALPRETHLWRFRREEEEDALGAQSRRPVPRPQQPGPPPPFTPSPGPAPPLPVSGAGLGTTAEAWRGGGRAARRLRAEAAARAFLCGSRAPADWLGRRCRRSGRSRRGAAPRVQSQPRAAADGAHFAAAGCALGLRRAELPRGCCSWALGSSPSPRRLRLGPSPRLLRDS